MELFLKRTGVYLIGILLAFSFFKVNGFFNNKKSEIIKSDGFGYYSYLPAMFIYGDYTQSFLPEKFPKYYNGTGIPEYMQVINNKPVDKYFFGAAVLMYPFFMTAHLLSIYFNLPADGYSVLYQYFIGLSAVFYIFLGIWFCNRLLRIYGATVFQSLFICLLLVFGTNAYFYATVEPSMSHAFSFAMITAFLYFSKEIFEYRKVKFIIPAFLALGMVILIRPLNLIIVLALPFLAGSFSRLLEGLRFLFKNYLHLFYGALFAFCIVSLQFVVWYNQTGQFIVYSYTYERFYFDKPHIFTVLFGYEKGLFIYTPLLVLSLAGFIYLFRKNIFSAISLMVFFFLLVYVMSCWHMWNYGASFGYRPMIEFFPLFALLLFFSLEVIKKKWVKFSFVLLCLFTIYINQIQAYQYRKFILHWDRMSSYKYWRVFLKTDNKWIGYVWDNPEPKDLAGPAVKKIFSDFEKPDIEWTGSSLLKIGEKAFSGTTVVALDANNMFSNTIVLNGSKQIMGCKKPAVIVKGFLLDKNRFPSDKLQLVISYDKFDSGNYYYKSRLVDNFTGKEKGWKKFEVAMRLDNLSSETDVVKIYFWNSEKQSFLIDDVSVEFIDQF
jgi:hypothetical protein